MTSESEKKAFKNLDDFLGEILLENSFHPYIFACEQLSRNYWSTNLYKNSIQNPDQDISWRKVLVSIIRFFIGNLRELFLLVIRKIMTKVFYQRKSNSSARVIQTFLNENLTIKNNSFSDNYLFGIAKEYKSKNIDFKYLCFYLADKGSLKKFYEVLNIIKKNEISIVLEFELLGFLDIFRLAIFILHYPLFHLNLIAKYHHRSKKYFVRSMLEEFHTTRISNYSKFMIGKNIYKITSEDSQIICWFENQSVNKCFFAGVNKNPKKIYSIGAQLLFFPLRVPQYYPTKEELQTKIIPQKVLYLGKEYIKNAPDNLKDRSSIGPSSRYQYIFKNIETFEPNKLKEYILLTLPYNPKMASDLFNYSKKFLSERKVILRIHPALSFSNDLPSSWEISNQSLFSDLKRSKILITAGSGTSVESLCNGVPALILNDSDPSSSYLPDYGFGEYWDSLDNNEDPTKKIQELIEKEIDKDWYKKNMLSCSIEFQT